MRVLSVEQCAGRADQPPWRIAAIKRVLEESGVEFTNGDQPGVRMRKARAVE
jgi:hypothetical protein